MVLSGTTLDNGSPGRLAAWTYRLGFGRFAKKHTVYVINRRRGMPPGYSTRDYARAIEGEV